MLRVPSLTPPVQCVARFPRSARATCSRCCASSLPLGVPSRVARALRGLYRRNCRAWSAWVASWPHPNGGQRCRPARHRGMNTREDEGCKEAAGVHSCAGRCGTGLFTCSGVADCVLCASCAFYAVCTFDSVTASEFAFPWFSCFARSIFFADKLGGVAAAVWVSV